MLGIKRKAVSGTILILLLISMFTLAFNIQPVEAYFSDVELISFTFSTGSLIISDTKESVDNTVTAGELDLVVTESINDFANMEIGVWGISDIDICNVGSLDFTYTVQAEWDDTDSESSQYLFNALNVKVNTIPDMILIGGGNDQLLRNLCTTTRFLPSGECDQVSFQVRLCVGADNTYQNLITKFNLIFTASQIPPNTIYVPDYYSTIQEAVNAASLGDIIIVRAGTYTENIVVNKEHLTIKSESGAEVTIVQAANPDDHVFEVIADYVNIRGFMVEGASSIDNAGIYLENAYSCNISNNIASDNADGITLYYSNNNIISNNNCSSNDQRGILFEDSTNNIIENNTCLSCNYGILFHSSNNNLVEHNICSGTMVDGIRFNYSNENTVIKNICSSNFEDGIFIGYSDNNFINNNTCTNNWAGIRLEGDSNKNTIFNNNYHSNFYGIVLNQLVCNNIICLNNLKNNHDNVKSDTFNNIWNSPEKIIYNYNSKTYTNYLGNYWSDYTGSDADGDGIGDTSYSIDGDQDNYPLMEPFENYFAPCSDLGFRANSNGYKFTNFGTSRTWEMFEQFFGRDNVLHPNGERIYAAEQFFEENYGKYVSGSCDGFATTSLINFKHLDQPNVGSFAMPFYDPLYAQDLDEDINEAIAYQQGFWWSLEIQSHISSLSEESGNSPKFFYEKIREYILSGEPVILWIWEEPEWWGEWQKGGGHALVPYRYEEPSENEVYIYVYDSNHPGDNNRKVIFDLKNDEWSYKFQKVWWQFSIIWEGDSSYPSMMTIPLDMRLHKGVTPWAQRVSPYAYVCSSIGPASPLFTNPEGHQIGFVDGKFVNEIPKAEYILLPTQTQEEILSLWYLPEDAYSVTLRGIDEDTYNFNGFGDHSLIQIKNVEVNPSTIDTINFGKDSTFLIYTTNDAYKEYSAVLDEELVDRSRVVTVTTSISGGDTITLEITPEQTFKYVNLGDLKTYDLILEQRGTGFGYISFSDLTIEAEATHTVKIEDWDNLEATDIILEIDEDSDGAVDKTENLAITFEDSERATKLYININDKCFRFITPDKDYGIREATYMRVHRRTITIQHKDSELRLITLTVDTKLDFCVAIAWDVETRTRYFLIDKAGIED